MSSSTQADEFFHPAPGWPGAPVPRPRTGWRTYALHVLLFLATAASVYTYGGIRLVVSLMSILLAHEMGHYIACRYYRVDATLPFFIPGPPAPFGLVGTFGALIRIREPIPHRRALFDIGIAGPLAGFAVCLVVLSLATMEATVMPMDRGAGPYLGAPLLLRWAMSAVRGPLPAGMTWVIGPFGQAAWFGLLVTALNLIPVGQLDGGHVTYALLRRHATLVSRAGLGLCFVLLYFRPTWLLWSILLLVFGRRRHPPTLNDRAPVGAGRVAVGVLGLAVFAVSFTPSPLLISWREFLEAFGWIH